jgi:hypothetical protein
MTQARSSVRSAVCTTARSTIATFLAAAVLCTSMLQTAQAAVIGTEAVAAAQAAPATTGHAALNATLERADVVEALRERGVDVDAAKARVAALSDAEAAQLAKQIDEAPAGAANVLAVIAVVFVILLITDLLGFTRIFPFIKPIR